MNNATSTHQHFKRDGSGQKSGIQQGTDSLPQAGRTKAGQQVPV